MDVEIKGRSKAAEPKEGGRVKFTHAVENPVHDQRWHQYFVNAPESHGFLNIIMFTFVGNTVTFVCEEAHYQELLAILKSKTAYANREYSKAKVETPTGDELADQAAKQAEEQEHMARRAAELRQKYPPEV